MMMLVNDSIVSREQFGVDPEDRGYQFGDGIYEVMRLYNGQMFEWEAHLARLQRSAAELRLSIPIEPERLTALLMQLIAESQVLDGHVYLQLTRGVAPRMHAFPDDAVPVLTANVREGGIPRKVITEGISVITTADIRWLRVDIKSLNLLGNVLAKQEAKEAGAAEAILIRNDVVTEGSSSNLFGILDGRCYTHPANHLILNGITRQVVIRLLAESGIELLEKPMTQAELMSMDEVFITSTGHEVCPVIEIDGKPIGTGQPGLYTRRLQAAFSELIVQYV